MDERNHGTAVAEALRRDPLPLRGPRGSRPVCATTGRTTRLHGTSLTSARARQVAKGLGPPWVDAVDGFLARWAPRDGGIPALLHTEVMREHMLVTGSDRGWRLAGLVDFEPAMYGAREYEFASVGLFLACAEPGLLRAVLEGYGAAPDPELPLRLMAYVLLHRYSNLPWYLERLPMPSGCRDLEHLARAWFTP